MRRVPIFALAVAVLGAASLLFAGASAGDVLGPEIVWKRAPMGQYGPTPCPDGSGGAFIGWTDELVYPWRPTLVRVDANGEVVPGWPEGGRYVMTSTGYRALTSLAPDGAGGSFIGATEGSLPDCLSFTQHVNPDGPDGAWTGDGTSISVRPSPQPYSSVASDGAGGVFTAWLQGYPSGTVCLQHQQPGGQHTVEFGSAGLSLGAGMWEPAIAPDGSGGVFVLRLDPDHVRLALHRVAASGTSVDGWPSTGVELPLAGQYGLALLEDGNGGAFVFADHPGMQAPGVVHVLADGVPDARWSAQGVSVTTSAGSSQNYSLVPDGAGGVIASWITWPLGYDHDPEVRVQRVLSDGRVDPRWSPDGFLASSGRTDEFWPVLAEDGRGGAFVAWWNASAGDGSDHDAFAMHVRGDGHEALGWPAGGLVLTGSGRQEWPRLVHVTGGALAVWEDGSQDGGYADVVGRKLLTGSEVVPPAPAPGLAFRSFGPNPFASSLRVELEVPAALELTVEALDLSGRHVATIVSGPVDPGIVVATWNGLDDSGRALRSGVYLLRARSAAGVARTRVALVR